MNKWDYINILREEFSDEQIVDMFVYWLNSSEVEDCIIDFLNDRDLQVKNGYIKEKK